MRGIQKVPEKVVLFYVQFSYERAKIKIWQGKRIKRERPKRENCLRITN